MHCMHPINNSTQLLTIIFLRYAQTLAHHDHTYSVNVFKRCYPYSISSRFFGAYIFQAMGVFNSDLVIKIVLRSYKGSGEYFAIAVEHLSKWLEVCDMRFSCTLYLLRGWWVVLADDTHPELLAFTWHSELG